MSDEKKQLYDVIILGSGPAGYSAALYAVRANLKTLLFKGDQPGGQLITTTSVENYLGLDDTGGWELTEKFRVHAEKYGLETLEEHVDVVNRLDSGRFEAKTKKGTYESRTVIAATGASAKRLHLPNEEKFWNKGISACAVCDGALPMFRSKPLAVVGGGDTACEEALFLSRFASKVYLIHRRNKLRASHIMQQRVMTNDKIEMVWNTHVVDVMGTDLLNAIRCQSTKDSSFHVKEVAGLFYAIGHVPNSQFLDDSNMSMSMKDEAGYIITAAGSTKTYIPGFFACGDVADKVYRQAITSAGTGCMAALDAGHYLQ